MANKPRNRTADFAVYLAVRFVVCVIQALPPRLAYALADAVAWLVYRAVGRRREIALANIREAFPELRGDPVAADRLVREMFRHFIRAAFESAFVARKLTLNTWRRHFVLPHGARLLPRLQNDRPTLIVSGHLGNWELAGISLGLFGYHTHAIARTLDNPHLERYIRKFRTSTGQGIIAKNGDFADLTQILKSGGKVAVLADQDAGPRGAFVNYFGRLASTHKSIALLAMQHDAVLVVVGVPRVNRADYAQHPDRDVLDGLDPMFYAVTCEDVIDPREYAGISRTATVKAITQRYTSALEALVRRHPEQYFWLHRRWKTQPAVEQVRRAA